MRQKPSLRYTICSFLALVALCSHISLAQTLQRSCELDYVTDVTRALLRGAGQFTTDDGLPQPPLLGLVATSDETVWAIGSYGVSYYDNFRWNPISLTEEVDTQALSVSAYANDGNSRLILLAGAQVIQIDGKTKQVRQSEIQALSQRALSIVPPVITMLRGETGVFIEGEFFGLDGEVRALALDYQKEGVSFSVATDSVTYVGNNYEIWELSEAGEQRVASFDSPTRTTYSHFYRSLRASSMYSQVLGPFLRRGLHRISWNERGQSRIERISRDQGISFAGFIRDTPVFYNDQGEVYAHCSGQRLSRLDVRSAGDFSRFNLAYMMNGYYVAQVDDYMSVLPEGWPQTWFSSSMAEAGTIADMDIDIANGWLWAASDSGLVQMRTSSAGFTFERIITDGPDGPLRGLTGVLAEGNGVAMVSGAVLRGVYHLTIGPEGISQITKSAQQIPRVHKLFETNDGSRWLAGLSEVYDRTLEGNPGLFRVQGPDTLQLTHEDGLPHSRVYAVEPAMPEIENKAYWVATLTGVAKIEDGDRGPVVSKPFANVHTSQLAADTLGGVWFNYMRSRNVSLGYIDQHGQVSEFNFRRLAQYTQLEIRDLFVDDNNLLFAATKEGLGILGPERNVLIGKSGGLPSTSLMVMHPYNDDLVFGTEDGRIFSISMRLIRDDRSRVFINLAQLGQDGTGLLTWQAYDSLGYRPSHEIPTRIRKDGGPWSPWTTTGSAEFAELPSGVHLIEIQAQGPFGMPGRYITRHTFVVTRASWQASPMVWMLISGLGGILLILVFLVIIQIVRNRAEIAQTHTRHGEERERWRRNLHDGVASRLSILLTEFQQLVKEKRQLELSSDQLARYTLQTREALGEVRRLMGSRAKVKRQTPTLEALVGRIVNDYEEILEVSLSFKTKLVSRKVRAEAEDQLAPILREAFVNVMQHAGSNKASLHVYQIDEKVVLVIANTDVSASDLETTMPNDVLAHEPGHRGIGLESMQRRIEFLNGRFAFASKFGVFTIELQIPIETVFEAK